MVAGGKASSGGINEVAGCLLFLSADEASELQIVVTKGVVHPLAVKASGGSVCEMVGAVCYFSRLARRLASCDGWRQGLQR